MDKQNLAYKLTTDVIKNYGLEKLEKEYKLFGADLFVDIFNKIFSGLSVPSENTEKSEKLSPVIFTGEDKILP